jgi:peptide deformylase
MEYKLGPHQSLVTVSDPWDFATDQDPEQLEHDMIDFMIKNRGIGLAANQIGLTKRVFVMGSDNMPGFPRPFALFNPLIIEQSQESVLDQEGCLSYPGLYLSVKRPAWVVAAYQDSQGTVREVKIDGYLSKCFQHELDHLNGICFVDKVSQLKLNLAMKKLRKNNK